MRRIIVSCDSVRPDRFASITHRNALHRVFDGIDAAVAAGLSPVKVDCVLKADVGRRWSGHTIGQVMFLRPDRSMGQISG